MVTLMASCLRKSISGARRLNNLNASTMKKSTILSILVSCIFVLWACTGMNDNFDQYLANGEIVYIAKSDSVKIFPGKNRFLVNFWIKDPRAVSMDIQWNQGKSSQVVPIEKGHDITLPIEAYVENLEDGDYTLKFITHDAYGNQSVPDEYSVIVYGDTFQSMLISRGIKKKSVSGSTVTITWGSSFSNQEYGVNVYYTDLSGTSKCDTFLTEEIGSPVSIKNVDTSKEISYETIYLPEENAIDYFYTEKKVI